MCARPDGRLFRDAREVRDRDLSQSNGAEGSHTQTLSENHFNPFRDHTLYLRDAQVHWDRI